MPDRLRGEGMTSVSCPECDQQVIIGLPLDASIESVRTGASRATEAAGVRKTRVVRCPQEHGVAVTFSVNESDHSDHSR